MKLFGTKWTRILFQALGIALFIVILTRVDLGKIARAYRHMNYAYAATGIVLLFLLTLLKADRWKRILMAQGTHVGLWRAFTVYSASLYLGVVTPARIGDFAKSLYLMNEGLSAGKALFSSVVDRLFDIVFLVVVGYVSLLFFPGIFRNQLLLSSLVLGIVLLVTAACFWRRDILQRIMRRFVSRMPGVSIRSSLDAIITESLAAFGTLTRRVASYVILLTVLSGMAHYLFFVVLSDGLGLGVSVPVVIVCVSAAVFTALLPVSFSGLGTRELVLILIFKRAGLSPEAAVTFSFSFILVYLIQGFTGFVCWLAVPMRRERGSGTALSREEP